jgi:hypothetical protein
MGLGWIVTFIIRERNGGSGAGYISSGFFGGITLGRVVLMWFNRKVCPLFWPFAHGIIGMDVCRLAYAMSFSYTQSWQLGAPVILCCH